MTDEEILEVREYFSRQFDGCKVVPIIDELLELREKYEEAMFRLIRGEDESDCPEDCHR